ncbi:MAG: metalloregulator ArsR/SmtB family transcription factor [Candidatus Krumholzibacteria bacterium]|jgi:ArsR family transcriptional regulator|nr:metalloregulator ArsR/SmtB family transcription factor [Candidatus Krumholzibacteria bacterium]MDP6668325.1 metalloregulator ArsR/SmtB family transcription factor [Candidatus Krumholzibacteria bacterium]MDP6798098.1 metalloregulator ArsR/SmtB family transcription factor [Candidatus Krumholzibacteria bacterium]MDP7022129.1 metalloregulator ArsR/SmtB family transcription factor [Candidatus Krumholzibacteria bacterium]
MAESHRSDDSLRALARHFRMLSEPLRLQILEILAEGEQGVQELVSLTGQAQPHVSRQLSLLAESGFLLRRKEGTRVFYSLKNRRVRKLLQLAEQSLREEWRELLKRMEE